jgi:hypothetical protein
VAKLGLSRNDAQVAESIGRTVERLIVAVKTEDVKEKALQAQTYSWQITDAYFEQPPSGRALSKAVERIARERR